MDEVYTCTCGGQKFQIHDGFIRCANCQREVKLTRINKLSGAEASILEDPGDFNERIRLNEKTKKEG